MFGARERALADIILPRSQIFTFIV